MIKFIDAKQNLSVQVHPDDDYAREHENGSLGKSEMWYVLEAAKDASLIYGFCRDITQDMLKKSLADGTVEKYMHRVPVQRTMCFISRQARYMPLERVHSLRRSRKAPI